MAKCRCPALLTVSIGAGPDKPLDMNVRCVQDVECGTTHLSPHLAEVNGVLIKWRAHIANAGILDILAQESTISH